MTAQIVKEAFRYAIVAVHSDRGTHYIIAPVACAEREIAKYGAPRTMCEDAQSYNLARMFLHNYEGVEADGV